jgi:tetratricopeptide (TPR) repeat protein
LGDFERSRQDYERALELAGQTDDQLALWEGLIDLGFLWLVKDYLRAGEYLRQALDLAAVLDDPTLLARSLNRYGNWYLNREMPLEAIKLHKQALEIFTRTEDRQGLAETLDLIGTAHSMGSSFLDSYAYFERASLLFDESGTQVCPPAWL